MKRAKDAVCNRITAGAFRPVFCELCGFIDRVEGHHPNYSRIYDVVWLCRQCHCNVHKDAELARAVAPLAFTVQQIPSIHLAFCSLSCDLYSHYVLNLGLRCSPPGESQMIEQLFHHYLSRLWMAKKLRALRSFRRSLRTGEGKP